jgi:hypothetical protein
VEGIVDRPCQAVLEAGSAIQDRPREARHGYAELNAPVNAPERPRVVGSDPRVLALLGRGDLGPMRPALAEAP